MKNKIKYLSILISFLLLINCKTNLLTNKKKELVKAEKYKIECLNLKKTNNKDTIILKDGNICIFGIKNKNFSIGKIENKKQLGVWYYYRLTDNNYKCHHIINKKKNGDFKLIYSSGIKNYRYF